MNNITYNSGANGTDTYTLNANGALSFLRTFSMTVQPSFSTVYSKGVLIEGTLIKQ